MKKLTLKLFSAATTLVFTLCGSCVYAAGFQHGFAADPDGKPLQIGIWYPSHATTQPLTMGPTTMNVAVNGTAQGKALPLVVMSHGPAARSSVISARPSRWLTPVSWSWLSPTRAITMQTRAAAWTSWTGLVRSAVIDHMLSTWNGHATIDPARIGMSGFSAGGFTTLVSIGGIPDLSTVGPMCRQYPGDFACQLIAKSSSTTAVPLTTPAARAADPRIKAAVVAAPALGFTFSPDGLKNVKVPVQLWRADSDAILPHPRYAEAVLLALPETPDYHVVPNAGHFDFLVPCSSALASVAPAICTSAVGFDRSDQPGPRAAASPVVPGGPRTGVSPGAH